MSGDSKKPGGDGRDLLSELLDLEEDKTQVLGEEVRPPFEDKTPVDQILQTDSHIQTQTVDNDLDLFEDVSGLTELIEKPTDAVKPSQHSSKVAEDPFESTLDDATEMLFKGDSAPKEISQALPSEDVRFFSEDLQENTVLEQNASPPPAADFLESALFGEESSGSEGSQAQGFGTPEKTVILDSASELKPADTSSLESDDPIDLALNEFEPSSQVSGETPDSKSPEISADDFAPASSAPKSSPDEAPVQLSQADFADVFSSGPIQVNQHPTAAHKAKFKFPKKLVLSGLSMVAGLAVMVGLWTTLSSESGILGYRLEGFSLEEVYRAPEGAVAAEIEKALFEARQALLLDDPEKLKASFAPLKEVLVKDVRNLEAVLLQMQISAVLMSWEGSASAWAKDFERASNQFSEIQIKLKNHKPDGRRQLMDAYRQWAIGDLKMAKSTLDGLADLEDAKRLRAIVAFQLGDQESARKFAAEVKDNKDRPLQYIRSLMDGQNSIMDQLAKEGYLPARIERELASIDLQRARDELSRLEDLFQRVKTYPAMAVKIREKRAELYEALGEKESAQAEWSEILKLQPSNPLVHLKLADSYEEVAQWDKAIESLQAATRLGATDKKVVLRLTRLLRERMKIVEALDVIDKSLATTPKDADFHYEKGLTQLAVFQEEPAKQSFQKALEERPNFEQALLSLASIASRQQDWQEAERLLKQIPDSSNNFPQALLGLGQMALKRHRLEEAQKYFALSIRKNPATESAYDGLVQLLLRREEDAKAMAIVDEGLKALPKSGMLSVAKARVLSFQGLFDEAQAMLKPYLSRYEHDLEFQFARVDLLLDARRMTEASKEIERLGSRDILDPEFHYLKARYLYLEDPDRGGNKEAANRSLASALRTRFENERYLLLKGRIELDLDERATALETANTLIGLFPDSARAYILKGDVAFESANYAVAIDAYQSALNHTRFSSGIFRKLAILHRASGNSRKALEYFVRVVRQSPQDADAHLELGKIYNENQRPQKAVEHLRTAVQLNPGLSEAHFHLGYILKELGDQRGAIRSFESYLSRNPNAVEAATIRDEIFFLKQQVIPN